MIVYELFATNLMSFSLSPLMLCRLDLAWKPWLGLGFVWLRLLKSQAQAQAQARGKPSQARPAGLSHGLDREIHSQCVRFRRSCEWFLHNYLSSRYKNNEMQSEFNDLPAILHLFQLAHSCPDLD
jgi:hypothetical protein